MSDLSRELAQAARRDADEQARAINSIPRSRFVNVTVAQVSPTKVTWRGVAVPVSGTNMNYTPVAGHRVLCAMDDSNQLIIICRLG